MTPKQVIKHFGTVRITAEALSVTTQNIYNWLALETIPRGAQCELEVITRGKLKADRKLVKVQK